MAKQALYDYSKTPGSNTDIDGVDSTGTTGLVKSGDNYTRSMMSHARGFLDDLGAVNTVAGTGDAITITLSSAPSALVDGMRLTFNASAANTTNVTLNVTPAGGAAFGSKKVLKWAAGVETALSANDIPAANALIELVYDTARDTAAGAWMLLGTSVAAATTSASGIVELATVAEALTGTDAVRAVTPAVLYYPTGHLYGLTLSNNSGTPLTKIDIAAGDCRDSTDTGNMVLAAALTAKDGTAAWAVGSSAGCLDTGAIANNTWYHGWLIKRVDTGVVDFLISTSATAPTMPTNYTLKRRIGSPFLTNGSAQFKAFTQVGDEFVWATPVVDINVTNPGTSAATRTLTVPIGVVVRANVQVGWWNGTNQANAYLSALASADVAPQNPTTSSLTAPLDLSGNDGVAIWWWHTKSVLTNTSGQIRSRNSLSGAADILGIITVGWADTRGRVV